MGPVLRSSVAVAQGPAGQRSGVLTLAHHDGAVNYNVLDAHRELLGMAAGGGRFHGAGIEHHDVSLHAFGGMENFFDLFGPTVEGPFGDQDEKPSAAVGVMKAVHGDVLALAHSAIDPFRERKAVSGMGQLLVGVDELTENLSLLPDLQRPFHRVQN